MKGVGVFKGCKIHNNVLKQHTHIIIYPRSSFKESIKNYHIQNRIENNDPLFSIDKNINRYWYKN